MATNLKRIPVKYIRDAAKSAYTKMSVCYICDTSEELELHHTNGITNLMEAWMKKTGNTEENVLEWRDQFIAEHHTQIYVDVFTLCLVHHRKLHSIYGKSPALSTANKQKAWIELQKEKFNNPSKEQLTSTSKSGTWIKHLLK